MITMTQSPTLPTSVLAQVAQLSDLSTRELKALWTELNDTPPTIHSKPLLVRRLAHQLQTRALPRPWQTIAQQNKERITALIQQQDKPQHKRKVTLPAGTVLTRFYRGEEHIVTVTETQEFNYKGHLFTSLSVIARQITGTRWSGPLFFGLRPTQQKKD